MRQFFVTTAAVLALAVSATGASATVAASAITYSDTFTITAYKLSNLSSSPSSSDAAVQALPSAIAAANSPNPLGTFTYTGMLNFSLASGAPNTLAAFIGSGGGTVKKGDIIPDISPLSTATFADSTLLKISFTTPASLTGTITNDDGISLFKSGDKANGLDLLPVSQAAPTNAVPNNFAIASGSYDLYYAEVNGLPAQLKVVLTSVPEPASMALLGAGLLGVGLLRRKRQA